MVQRLIVGDKDAGNRSPTRYCEVCGEHTRERKPVCPEHIFEEPYPKRLLDIIEGAEDEVKRAGLRGYKEISLDGLVVEEILAGLKANAEVTWKRLIKDHVPYLNGASEAATNAYLIALKRSGLVATRLSKRRDEIVSLSEKGYQKVSA